MDRYDILEMDENRVSSLCNHISASIIRADRLYRNVDNVPLYSPVCDTLQS